MKKILVVDNDQVLLRFMTNLLEKEGHQVIAREDGLKALDVLKTYLPDIIYLDLIMPKIDGRRLCRIIRSTERLKDVYITILSAISAEESIDIVQLGADACIVKGPFNEMAQNVLDVLYQPELMSSQCLAGIVLGRKNIYPRGITEELLTVKKHFEIILEKMSEGILEISSEGRILYANPAALALIDLPEKKLVGSYYVDVFPEDACQRICDFIKIIDGQPKARARDTLIHLSGNQVMLNMMHLDEDTSTYIISLHDVSESKRAEEELRNSKNRLEILYEYAPDAYWLCDLKGVFTDVNKAMEELVGYQKEELVGKNILKLNLLPSKLITKVKNNLVQNSKLTRPVEFNVKRKDGSQVILEIRTHMVQIEGQSLLLGIARDITERRRIEHDLRESEKRINTILENIMTGVVVIDPETRIIVDANTVALEMIGISREQVVGRVCHNFICPAESGMCPILDQGHKSDGAEQVLLTGSGRQVPILKRTVSVTLDGRDYLLESFLDITKLKEAQFQAEAASRIKSEFLASMSHEIRTPMTAVIGMADLLYDTPLTDEQKEYLEVICSSGENLLQLINTILDLSKLEADRMAFENTPFNLLEVVKNMCEAQAFSAHEKGLDLVCWVRPGVEMTLLGDPVRLGQVLSNLVENAIKFTEAGEVFIEVQRQDASRQIPGEGKNLDVSQDPMKIVELLFSVTDTGIGIPPEKQEAVFDRFTQVDASSTRQYGGAGLGLAISRRLLEHMGGHMWVESRVGKGSTFFFTARFELQPGEAYVRMPEADISGVKTLIIDDNATNRMVLAEMLFRWGALVTEQEEGQGGLDEMRRAKAAGDPYGLILLDGRMPGMDGFQVAETIQGDPELSGPVVMMLTSDDRERYKERSKVLGIADCLVKPVKWSDLKKAVMAALGREEAASWSQSPVAKAVVREDLIPLHILLVEDNAKNCLLFQAYLKETPYTLDIAENGEIAVEKFVYGEYDLVLMDIKMPVMDGYTATGKIRQWETQNRVKATPIIALSAHALTEDRQKSLDAGLNDHLTKPIKKLDLLAAIEKYGPRIND